MNEMNHHGLSQGPFDLPHAPLAMPKQVLEQPLSLWLRLANVLGMHRPVTRAEH